MILMSDVMVEDMQLAASSRFRRNASSSVEADLSKKAPNLRLQSVLGI